MMRAGRMATFSLQVHDPVGPDPQRGGARSRQDAGRASPQRRTGLDPAAIVNRNENAAGAPSVVLEVGMGAPRDALFLVEDHLAGRTQVCS